MSNMYTLYNRKNLYRPGQSNQDFFKTTIFMIYKCYNDMLYRYVTKI